MRKDKPFTGFDRSPMGQEALLLAAPRIRSRWQFRAPGLEWHCLTGGGRNQGGIDEEGSNGPSKAGSG